MNLRNFAGVDQFIVRQLTNESIVRTIKQKIERQIKKQNGLKEEFNKYIVIR